MEKTLTSDMADMLGIPVPNIRRTSDKDILLNGIACADPTHWTIWIKESATNEDPTEDDVCAIAHEMRHLWQYKRCRKEFESYMATYKRATTSFPINDYNSQPVELDAHAFAFYFMTLKFGIQPAYDTFSEDLRKKIRTRADWLANGNVKTEKISAT